MERVEELFEAFFNSKSPRTIAAYLHDLETFRRHLDLESVSFAVDHLIKVPHSQANLIVLHYKVEMLKNGSKAITINRRLSTLRSLIKCANKLNIISWKLDIENDPLRPAEGDMDDNDDMFQQLLTASRKHKNPGKADRDTAILRLLHDLALKRHSVSSLDLSDFDPVKKTIAAELPGATGKITKQLPPNTLKCLKRWLKHRGIDDGPLFTNFDHAGKGQRLSGSSIYRIVRQRGIDCGFVTSPQLIRNSAIQKALRTSRDAAIDSSELIAFSDHKNPSELRRVRKNTKQIQSIISKLIAD